MTPLNKEFPDPKQLIQLAPEQLGHHVLRCLSETQEPNIHRAIIARTMSADYHRSFDDQIRQAIGKAIDWLIAQCLLGATPYDPELIFLTSEGKDHLKTRH